MKKLYLFALFFLAIGFVSAWHCTDTDQTQPAGAVVNWGDNALLGGTSSGWTSGQLPAGCTGTWSNAVCQDRCDGTTLVEYYCGPYNKDESIIMVHNYENSTQCNQVPEFGVVAALIAVVGAVGIIVYRRRH
jgi:hypothetical protein